MPVYEVPVTALVEAATPEDAMTTALPGENLPGRYVLGAADRPRELPPDEAAAKLEFAAALKMADSYGPDEYAEVEGHPGVKFSPMALAALRRLSEGG